MYPSERYRSIIEKAPLEARATIAEYADEAFHQGDPPSIYGVTTWKRLVQVLVELECGTPFISDDMPIKDYLTYKSAMRD